MNSWILWDSTHLAPFGNPFMLLNHLFPVLFSADSTIHHLISEEKICIRLFESRFPSTGLSAKTLAQSSTLL